jgi:hypothetical protein
MALSAVARSQLCVTEGAIEHTLRAEMNGAQMRVFADNELVWDGSVAPDAVGFDGPVGIRSDNVSLEIELLAGPAGKAAAQQARTCRAGAGEAE